MKSAFKDQLVGVLNSPVKWDCPLAGFTSFGIGGPAEALVTINDEVELQSALQVLHEFSVPWRVIGKGTNLLVRDEGVKGVILVLGDGFKDIGMISGGGAGYEYVEVGAANGLTKLSHWCVDKGLGGLEFASGIPGTVGGAVIMNAGAWGKDVAQVLNSVTVVDISGKKTINRAQLNFGYRCWHEHRLWVEPFLVTRVVVRGVKENRQAMKVKCEQYRQKRMKAQPQKLANAGSIFKNPASDSAGRLIEASGLKGTRVGGAEVSPVHANFIVNNGKATAADVLKLMALIKRRVEEDSGIVLEPEVHCL